MQNINKYITFIFHKKLIFFQAKDTKILSFLVKHYTIKKGFY